MNFVLVGNYQKSQSVYGLIAHKGLQCAFSNTIKQSVKQFNSDTVCLEIVSELTQSHKTAPTQPHFRCQL